MDIPTLQCLFSNAAGVYAQKLAAGVDCNLNLEYIATAYNYLLLADANLNKGCDIPASLYDDIIKHQSDISLTIQPCC